MPLAYKISQKAGVDRVPMVQASLNHTVLPLLGNHLPLRIFIGLQSPTPLQEFYLSN